ncbi:MAG: AAA family ATPase, partial [Cyclobacteriaceae bacterium]
MQKLLFCSLMQVFSRNILKDLERWKTDPQRKPLMLRGARQVGKTTVVSMFATRFDQFLYFNLEKVEEARIFKEIEPFDRLLEALFYLKNKSRRGG